MSLLDLAGYIKRGKNRKRVFLVLEAPMMPSEIVNNIYGKTSNTYFNIVSRALSELANKRLIEVVNPKDKTGRIYRKTKLGVKVNESL